MSYTFVTIAHQTDYDALCLQARSMNLYLPSSLVSQIIVIENPKINNHQHLLDQYGRLKQHVIIINAESIAPPEAFQWEGWWSQQILKLMIASLVKTSRYVALDAKNILVYPLGLDFLEKGNKPKTFYVDYRKHSSIRFLRHTLDYFSLPETYIKKFLPTTAPFVLVTEQVNKLIKYVETREETSFAKTFLKHELTEFFLYAGYLIWSKNLTYDFTGKECKTVWDVMHSDDYVRSIIAITEKQKLPFFSVHRRAIPMMSHTAKQEVNEFYTKHGLDSSGIIP